LKILLFKHNFRRNFFKGWVYFVVDGFTDNTGRESELIHEYRMLRVDAKYMEFLMAASQKLAGGC
jgi:hypothetical protein